MGARLAALASILVLLVSLPSDAQIRITDNTSASTLNRDEGQLSPLTTSSWKDISGLAGIDSSKVGQGVAAVDYDGDGDLDFYVSNFQEQSSLYRNEGGNVFIDVAASSGLADNQAASISGVFGDIDNDGDVDILISNSDGHVRLLINQIGSARSWITFSLTARDGNLNAIGADVKLLRNTLGDLHRHVHTDSSYLSVNDLRVHFGLGEETSSQTIEVLWPSGARERFTNLSPMQFHVITEGRGEVLP